MGWEDTHFGGVVQVALELGSPGVVRAGAEDKGANLLHTGLVLLQMRKGDGGG